VSAGAGAGGRLGRWGVLGLALASTALSLCGAELAVRAARPEPLSLYRASASPELVYELNPEHPDVEADGLRGAGIPPDALEGRILVAAIGDSHTYGFRVKSAAEAFPARMEERLRELLPGEGVTVLNFGVPGHNAAQHLAMLKQRVLPLRPRVVVLQSTINDTHVCNYIQPEHPWINRQVHRSALAVLAWKTLLYSPSGRRKLFERVGLACPDALLFQPGLVGTLSNSTDPDWRHRLHPARFPERVPARYHYMLGEDNWRRHVRESVEAARASGAWPLATGFLEPYQREQLESLGVAVLAFDDIVPASEMRALGYNPKNTGDHFKAPGNAVLGRALAERVAAELRAPPGRPAPGSGGR
jgi:lysophospholipase L1-like esterase